MTERREYEMTEADLATLLEAGKPVAVMLLSGGIPMHESPQVKANRAWKALGHKMGFNYLSVQSSGKGQRFFTAEPLTILKEPS